MPFPFLNWISFLVSLVIIVGVILLIREIVMWYWKINDLIRNQIEQKQILESIRDEIKKINK